MELPHMGRGFLRYPCGHEVQQVLLDFGFGQLGFAYALGQAGAAVGGGVPLVHAVEQLVALDG